MALLDSHYEKLIETWNTLISRIQGDRSDYTYDAVAMTQAERKHMLWVFGSQEHRYHLAEYVLDHVSTETFADFLRYNFSREEPDGPFELGLYACLRHFKRQLVDRWSHREPNNVSIQAVLSDSTIQKVLRMEALSELVFHRQHGPVHEKSIALQRAYYASPGSIHTWYATVGSKLNLDRMPNIRDIHSMFIWKRYTGGLLAISSGLSLLRNEKHLAPPIAQSWTFEDGLNLVSDIYRDIDARYLISSTIQRSKHVRFYQQLQNAVVWSVQSGVPPEVFAHNWLYVLLANPRTDRMSEMVSGLCNALYSCLSNDHRERIADYLCLFAPSKEIVSSVPALARFLEHTSNHARIVKSLDMYKVETQSKGGTYPVWGLYGSVQNKVIWDMLYSSIDAINPSNALEAGGLMD